MDLSAIIDEFNRRKAQAGRRISDMFTPSRKPADWFQQMQQGQNAVVNPQQRDNINRELADMVERFTAGVVPEPIRARDRAMQTDPSAAAKPFTSEEVKGITPFVTAAAPIAFHGTPHTWEAPPIPLYAVRQSGGPYSGGIITGLTKAEAEQNAANTGGLIMTHAELNKLNATSKRPVPPLPESAGGTGEMRPDASKIGTGQGAQSYGHGLYFAENPEVAGSYKRTGTNGQFAAKGLPVDNYGIAPTEAERLARSWLEYKDINPGEMHLFQKANPNNAADKILNDVIAGKITKDTGNMYQVNIPDQHAARMLDWDKPLSEQPANVKAAIPELLKQTAKSFPDANFAKRDIMADNTVMTGGQLYQMYSQHRASPNAASKALAELGIPGIKYLDQGSRTAGQGTRNFVVFDPAILEDVTRK